MPQGLQGPKSPAQPSVPPRSKSGLPSGWPQALENLIARIEQSRFRQAGLWRLSVPAPRTEPLDWLDANPWASRYYWRDRAGTLELAGLGIAWQHEASTAEGYAQLFTRARDVAQRGEASLFCAFAFEPTPGCGEWHEFPAALAVLPALELRVSVQGIYLAANLYAESPEDLAQGKERALALLDRLKPGVAREAHSPAHIVGRTQDPGYGQWSTHIAAILRAIEAGRIHKAVLARRVSLHLDQPLRAFETLKRWSTLTGGSYCFAIEHGERVFMGCSPERLFRRNGQIVDTEALAGTVRRGGSDSEEAALESLLREDPKLVREHAWVSRYIRSELAPWASAIEAPNEARVLKLDRIQHRQLPIRATLRAGVGESELMQALHPTPAVCGFPRQEAQELISREEPFQRGWYSGVVGTLSGDSSELAVAIRSALVAGSQLWCYSGVGIVEGSQADTEWQELEAKIESFLAAIET